MQAEALGVRMDVMVDAGWVKGPDLSEGADSSISIGITTNTYILHILRCAVVYCMWPHGNGNGNDNGGVYKAML